MTLEFIVFIVSILFGVLLYWKESKGNKWYRVLNKIINSRELQMKSDDRTGFVFQQKFILRLVYISVLFIALMLVLKFLIPINYTSISIFSSIIVGTLLGTYLANVILKSGKVIDEKGDNLGDLVSDTIEKGKEIIDDLTSKSEEVDESIEDKIEESSEDSKNDKSARERLKDKGFLK